MIPSLIALALLTVSDPAVGPAAADILAPPTSALYRNLAPFDLQEVAVLDEETLELRLQLSSYANPLDLENGFSHPIIEVYLGGGEFGTPELLPGSGMVLPDGETWSVAVQLTGDHARGWLATASGLIEFEPDLQIVDDYLYVMTDLPALQNPRIAAMTGLYSPFHQTGWRPLETEVNPWAFSSSEQLVPVVDVLALDTDAQMTALSGGVLPVTEVNIIENPNNLWFALMAIGIGIAGVGLVLRGFGRKPVAPAADVEDIDPVQAGDDVLVTPTPVVDEATRTAEERAESNEEPAVAEDPEATAVMDVEAEPEAVDTGLATAAAAGTASVVADSIDREPEDDPADEIPVPRVGAFRGQDDALVTPSDDETEERSEFAESGEELDFALPDYASVDFGEFEPAVAAEVGPVEPDTDSDALAGMEPVAAIATDAEATGSEATSEDADDSGNSDNSDESVDSGEKKSDEPHS